MYKFNLESLLNHRIYIEETLQKELAISKRLLVDGKNKLKTYQKEKEKYGLQLQQKQKEVHTVFEISLYVDYVKRLAKDIESQRKKVLEAKKKFGQKRNDLIEAMKKRKILEKLKAKGLEEYQKEMRKKELDFMNEVAVNQYNHNRSG
jgi:flagellar FliJ protein